MRFRSIVGKALHTAALLALLLVVGLALNALLFGYAVFRLADTDTGGGISEYAAALEAEEHILPPEMKARLDSERQWLMLLDGQGDEIYSYAKPQEIPAHFSLAEVAGFTRWYLMDYPVRVRTMGDGLLVMGFPKGSAWKYSFETSLPSLMFWPVWIAATLLLNFLLILIISAVSIDRTYKKRDAARVEWIAAVSHDVRTPLASVLGYAGSLENDAALPVAQREQAALIRSNGEKLRVLIENLNLTNRLQHSMEPLHAEWFSPSGVVREAAAELLNDEANAKYDISVDISPTAAQYQLWGDRALILRMLNNLIGNSLRHNEEGCSVNISLTAAWQKLTLSVADNGGGYSLGQLKALSGKTASLTSGHGLGLTIVRQIVQAHNGKIRFANSPSGGAECVIIFRKIRKIKGASSG